MSGRTGARIGIWVGCGKRRRGDESEGDGEGEEHGEDEEDNNNDGEDGGHEEEDEEENKEGGDDEDDDDEEAVALATAPVVLAPVAPVAPAAAPPSAAAARSEAASRHTLASMASTVGSHLRGAVRDLRRNQTTAVGGAAAIGAAAGGGAAPRPLFSPRPFAPQLPPSAACLGSGWQRVDLADAERFAAVRSAVPINLPAAAFAAPARTGGEGDEDAATVVSALGEVGRAGAAAVHAPGVAGCDPSVAAAGRLLRLLLGNSADEELALASKKKRRGAAAAKRAKTTPASTAAPRAAADEHDNPFSQTFTWTPAAASRRAALAALAGGPAGAAAEHTAAATMNRCVCLLEELFCSQRLRTLGVRVWVLALDPEASLQRRLGVRLAEVCDTTTSGTASLLRSYKAYAGPASELGRRLDASVTHADLGERLDTAYDEELRFQHENALRPLELASSHALAPERVLNARCARVLRAGQVRVAGGGGHATLLDAQASPANYFVKDTTASASVGGPGASVGLDAENRAAAEARHRYIRMACPVASAWLALPPGASALNAPLPGSLVARLKSRFAPIESSSDDSD